MFLIQSWSGEAFLPFQCFVLCTQSYGRSDGSLGAGPHHLPAISVVVSSKKRQGDSHRKERESEHVHCRALSSTSERVTAAREELQGVGLHLGEVIGGRERVVDGPDAEDPRAPED